MTINPETEKSIRYLHTTGLSERKIASETGVTRHHVRRILASPAPVQEPQGEGTYAPYLAEVITSLARSGRISRDSSTRQDKYSSKFSYMMGTDDQNIGEYRYEWMDSTLLKSRPVSELIEIAVNSSPEMSRAVWDFLRAAVPGWECRVIDPVTESEHKVGQALINRFRRQIALYHGGEEVLYTKMFMAILIRGSMLSEIYFENDNKTPVDIAVPDPRTLQFREIKDGVRGVRWQVGQFQGEKFIPLEGETIRYVVHDPLPGKPYSRSPLSAAIFPVIFLLGIFQDLRRVIANQGWPRLDVSVDVEEIQETLAAVLTDQNIAENSSVIAKQMDALIEQTQTTLAGLNPGDWFVHSSMVKINDAVGTLGEAQIGEITTVIEALERIAAKALKTMPILQGISDTASEANANRQWEMWAAGIKSLQHLVENSLQAHYNTVLQANGINAHCVFRFAEIRAAEELRDAQTLMMKLDNAIKAEQAGYMEADEAAMYVTNHAIPDSLKKDRIPLLNQLSSSGDMTQWADLDTDGNEADNENEKSNTAFTRAIPSEVLPIVPSKVSVNVLDAIDAADDFDDMIAAYKGILEAEVVDD